MSGVELGPDGRARCGWSLGGPEYVEYHDWEWGRPSHDDVGFAPEPAGAPPASADDLFSKTAESTEMAKELKRRGFAFVGPTVGYALMQAVGLVNDHLAGCAFRELPDA